jgi:O-antigen ligase
VGFAGHTPMFYSKLLVTVNGLVIAIAYFAALAWGGNEHWALALISMAALSALTIRIIAEAGHQFAKIKWEWCYLPAILFLAYALLGIIIRNPDPASKGLWFLGSVESYSTTVYFLLFLSCAAILFLTVSGFQTRRQVKVLVVCILVLGTFQAVYGLIQYLGDYDFIWQFKRGNYFPLASGTFINRNHYALLVNLCLCTGIGFLHYQGHRLLAGFRFSWRDALSAPGSAKLLWLLFWLILMGTGVIFSMSRMGILAMMAGLSAMLLASMATISGRKATLIGLLVIIAIVGLAAYIGVDEILARYEGLSTEQKASQNRLTLWRDGWEMTEKHLLFGQGLGTFQWTFPAYETADLDRPARYAHNDYLQMLAEMGVVGLGLLLWFFAAVWRAAVQNLRHDEDPLVKGIGLGTIGALTVLGLQEITDFGLYIPGVAVTAALIVGLNLRARMPTLTK